MALSKRTAVWVRAIVDYAALLSFVGVLVATRDFQRATVVLMFTSVAALALGVVVERRIAPIPFLTGFSAIVFGGLTLFFHDKSILKMKMTFVDSVLAIFLIVGTLSKRNPLKALLGDSFVLPDEAWRTLTIRYALFFAASAVANELVWRTQTDVRWAMFRIAAIVAAVIFSITQTPYLMKHLRSADDAVALEPPDAGL